MERNYNDLPHSTKIVCGIDNQDEVYQFIDAYFDLIKQLELKGRKIPDDFFRVDIAYMDRNGSVSHDKMHILSLQGRIISIVEEKRYQTPGPSNSKDPTQDVYLHDSFKIKPKTNPPVS